GMPCLVGPEVRNCTLTTQLPEEAPWWNGAAPATRQGQDPRHAAANGMGRPGWLNGSACRRRNRVQAFAEQPHRLAQFGGRQVAVAEQQAGPGRWREVMRRDRVQA